MRADCQRIINAFASVKCLSVDEALKVDYRVVAVGNRSVFNRDQSSVLVTGSLQLRINIAVCYFCTCLLYTSSQEALLPLCGKCPLSFSPDFSHPLSWYSYE